MGLFVVLCGYLHKNQCGLELKIILSIGNDEEPIMAISLIQEDRIINISDPYNLIHYTESFLPRSTQESGLQTKRKKKRE